MNETYDLRIGESHIEVHKFRGGAIVLATAVALLLQASVPVYFSKFSVLDLPLLLTIYFGLSRRNPSTGLLLGMTIGLLQDSLSGPTVPLGLYGIAKTIIGYLASSIGGRLDTEHPIARFALTMVFLRAPGGDSGDSPNPAGAAGHVIHTAPGDRGRRECDRRRFPVHGAR